MLQHISLLMIALLLTANFCSATDDTWLPIHTGEVADEEPDVAIASSCPNWKLLKAMGDRGEIQSIRVVIYSNDSFGTRMLPHRVDKIISDERTVVRIQHAFKSALRRADSDSLSSFHPGTVPYGQMQVKTSFGVVLIAFDLMGFGLQREFVGSDNVFYSWTLAKVIDDVVFAGTGKQLRAEQFDGLSGQWWLESQKKQFSDSQR